MLCCVLGVMIVAGLTRPLRRALGSQRRYDRGADLAVAWRFDAQETDG